MRVDNKISRKHILKPLRLIKKCLLFGEVEGRYLFDILNIITNQNHIDSAKEINQCLN